MISLLAALLSSAQPAGLTYLKCDANQRGNPVVYTITLNEPQGVAEWFGGGPYARRDRAVFTADAVYFQTFVIRRTDLRMQRRYSNVMGDGVEVENGACRVVQPATRAF